MTNWPTAPLIRIIDGHQARSWEVAGVLAFRNLDGDYYIPGRGRLSVGDGDRIDEWEEVTAVPTAALRDLLEAWRGTGGENLKWLRNVEDAMDPILSYLPADKSSPLDQAVTRVKETKTVAPRLADFDPEGRLALLLGDLATLQMPPLISIVRVCTEWVDLIAPAGDALSEVKARAESDPEWGGFTIMASLAGDIAVEIDEGMSDGPMNDLLAIAQYALAWAAQIIEEEDTHD